MTSPFQFTCIVTPRVLSGGMHPQEMFTPLKWHLRHSLTSKLACNMTYNLYLYTTYIALLFQLVDTCTRLFFLWGGEELCGGISQGFPPSPNETYPGVRKWLQPKMYAVPYYAVDLRNVFSLGTNPLTR